MMLTVQGELRDLQKCYDTLVYSNKTKISVDEFEGTIRLKAQVVDTCRLSKQIEQL